MDKSKNKYKFKWTDKKVIKFTRSVTAEVYTRYKDIKRLEDKLKHFKQTNQNNNGKK